jgi:phospholipid/cholesterol/gamma-HCH transport system ATP-binding protein
MIEIIIEKSFGDSKILKGISGVFETGKTNLILDRVAQVKPFY